MTMPIQTASMTGPIPMPAVLSTNRQQMSKSRTRNPQESHRSHPETELHDLIYSGQWGTGLGVACDSLDPAASCFIPLPCLVPVALVILGQRYLSSLIF